MRNYLIDIWLVVSLRWPESCEQAKLEVRVSSRFKSRYTLTLHGSLIDFVHFLPQTPASSAFCEESSPLSRFVCSVHTNFEVLLLKNDVQVNRLRSGVDDSRAVLLAVLEGDLMQFQILRNLLQRMMIARKKIR